MRKRYQSGTIVVEGDKVKRYKIRLVEYQIDETGHEVRKRRKVDLGLVSEIGTERAARRAAQPLLAEINANAGRPKHLITFAAVAKKWKTMILPSQKPASQRAANSQLAILEAAFGAVPIADISREMIQRWVSQQTDRSPKYIRNIISNFRVVWEAAQDWSYVSEEKRSPFDRVKLPKRGLVNRPTLTPEQIREVIRKADEPYRTFYWVAAETAARGGEICGLYTSDIDFENRTIHIRRSAWEGKLQTPKTGNAVRRVPVSEQLAEHLKGFIEARRSMVGRGGARRGVVGFGSAWQSDLLFTSSHGAPLRNGDLVSDRLKPLLKALGFDADGLGLHGFRRANISAMSSLGTPAKVLQERAGHGDIKTSMIYMSSYGTDHQKVANELGEIFNPELPSARTGTISVVPCSQEHKVTEREPVQKPDVFSMPDMLGDSEEKVEKASYIRRPVQKPDNPLPEWALAQGAD